MGLLANVPDRVEGTHRGEYTVQGEGLGREGEGRRIVPLREAFATLIQSHPYDDDLLNQ